MESKWLLDGECTVSRPVEGRYASGNSISLGNPLPIRNRILHRLPPHRCHKWHFEVL